MPNLLNNLEPGKFPTEPPIPQVIHRFLESRRFETEDAFAKFVASKVAEECQPPYHEEVRKVKHYLRIVNPSTVIARINRILRG